MDASMYSRAAKRTAEVVAGTKPEQFNDPTPCGDWDVRALLDHIISGCTVSAAGASERNEQASAGGDLVGDDHVASYERAAAAAAAAFEAPGAMEKTFHMPWGGTPGSAVLGTALADIVVHGWDLAQATGQEIVIDDDVAEEVYGMTTSMMAPKGKYPRGDRFAEPVDLPNHAPIRDKMLAYLGRKP